MQLEYAICEPEPLQCSSCRLTASLYHKGVLHILSVAAHLVCMQLTTVSSLLTLSIFAAASAVPCGPRHCHDNKRPDQRTDTDHRPDRPNTQGTRGSPQTDLTRPVCIDETNTQRACCYFCGMPCLLQEMGGVTTADCGLSTQCIKVELVHDEKHMRR